ncbi:schwannomin-interacting protein 1-like [Narcine bancroftii]|uniref:schwannomin-interacting protein 1-like n=1 Tax=Narcine bancroftii TaxID=1343680 RepID=UPI003831CE79
MGPSGPEAASVGEEVIVDTWGEDLSSTFNDLASTASSGKEFHKFTALGEKREEVQTWRFGEERISQSFEELGVSWPGSACAAVGRCLDPLREDVMDLGGIGNSVPAPEPSKPAKRAAELGPGPGVPRERIPGCGLKIPEYLDVPPGISGAQNGLSVSPANEGSSDASLQSGRPTQAVDKTAEGPSPGPWWPDDQMPIMDWAALENHIAGLQLREMEKQARGEVRLPPLEPPSSPLARRRADGTQRLVSWHRADTMAWRIMGNTISCESRFHSRMNLQLCFINDSSSESDPEEAPPSDPLPQPEAGEIASSEWTLVSRRKQLEREAKQRLAAVTRQLETERQRRLESAASNPFHSALGRRKPLDPSDLWDMSLVQIEDQRNRIFSQIHPLNTQLMELLEIRDDLKTEQDAMLVEIGDLTH